MGCQTKARHGVNSMDSTEGDKLVCSNASAGMNLIIQRTIEAVTAIDFLPFNPAGRYHNLRT
jgi:hypothetical protein